MHNPGFSSDEQHEKLLRMIDWVHRTGWPARARDSAVATRVFDTWWHLTEPASRDGERRDRRLLREALAAVFGATYDQEVVEHLCAMFAAVFERHIRSREETAGSGEFAWRPHP